jgi:hypothetical protein
MQYIWEWQDSSDIGDLSTENLDGQEVPIGVAPAWWEDMVLALSLKEGRINLG